MVPRTYKFFECPWLFDGLAMNCECHNERQSLIDDLPPVDSAGMWHLILLRRLT